jgi:mitosis inhibitor protein kinase SWE1
VEVGEVGSGEFGKVIKVRRKDGDNSEVYAIKKSKRFEGVRHRSVIPKFILIGMKLARIFSLASV